MTSCRARAIANVLSGGAVILCAAALGAAVGAQESAPASSPAASKPASEAPVNPPCDSDLNRVGHQADVVSNVLVRAELKPEAEVKAFLKDAETRFATSDDVRRAAADHFGIDQKRMDELVEAWRHINCRHEVGPGYVVPDAVILGATGEPSSPVPYSAFAADVTLHVVLHELGHAVIREFDLMILGNEETMADAFATHVLTEHLPERALGAISARVTSLMIEASEVPRDQWTVRGEHDSDARRAYQIAALALAADKDKFAGVAQLVGMSERDISKAMDYGAEIHRSWRRTLSPLLMPAGMLSKEARFKADDATGAFVETGEPNLRSAIESMLRRIDWHSQVTVDFVGGEGGAAWSRSQRTIKVSGEYLRRFIAQGVKADAAAATSSR